MRKYILDGRTAVEEPDLIRWVMWFETANRVVCQDWVGPRFVSTVFLGLDHNFAPNGGDPILFETMVFLDGAEVRCWRTSSWNEAEGLHKLAVAEFSRLS